MARKPDTGYLIPDDWTGKWTCIQVDWPDSPQWLAILAGVLSEMGRGRKWGRESGTITDVQKIGREIFDKSWPFRLCSADGTSITQDTANSGGSIIIEDEDMGQVVTDCWVDTETGELVVEFGPCCVRRYSLAALPQDYVPDSEDENWPDPPENLNYTACSKANALYQVWKEIIDEIFDGIPAGRTPMEIKATIETQYSIKLGTTEFLLMYGNAVEVVFWGLASECETPDWMREVLCQWSNTLTDDANGVSEAEQDALRVLVWNIATKHFTITAFPPCFYSMAQVWLSAYECIGTNDRKKITTYVQDDGTITCCSGEGPSYDWFYNFNFEDRTCQWTIIEDDHVVGTGFRGTDNWWDGSRLNTLRSPANQGPATGAITQVILTWAGGDLSNTEHFEADGLRLLDTVPHVIASGEQMRLAGFGTKTWEGTWSYNDAVGGNLQFDIDYSQGDTGERTIVSNLFLAGTGDPPIPAPGWTPP